jgi:hypothetical protein
MKYPTPYSKSHAIHHTLRSLRTPPASSGVGFVGKVDPRPAVRREPRLRPRGKARLTTLLDTKYKYYIKRVKIIIGKITVDGKTDTRHTGFMRKLSPTPPPPPTPPHDPPVPVRLVEHLLPVLHRALDVATRVSQPGGGFNYTVVGFNYWLQLPGHIFLSSNLDSSRGFRSSFLGAMTWPIAIASHHQEHGRRVGYVMKDPLQSSWGGDPAKS